MSEERINEQGPFWKVVINLVSLIPLLIGIVILSILVVIEMEEWARLFANKIGIKPWHILVTGIPLVFAGLVLFVLWLRDTAKLTNKS